MDWKGPREWAIERDSVKNKKKYAERWGYDLEITDMSTKKRYAHEWRESWEKVDIIRNCMRKYPNAEWCDPYQYRNDFSCSANLFPGSGGSISTHS
jgi:mannan polymerase II complex MNN10 subunit